MGQPAVVAASASVPAPADLAVFDALGPKVAELRRQLHRVIVGQDEVIDALIAAVLCQGHVLIVGVPGLAKTLLVRTLARAVDLRFRRIQFTPDLMPADILGCELLQDGPQGRELRFTPGPIFAQLILADEINRTPPKTQAALLEAMAEKQVTIGGRTLPLDPPFLVAATQNPIEQEGAYPLPEAQLDRFLFSLWMDYPSKEQEVALVEQAPRIQSEQVQAVFDCETLLRSADAVWRMPVAKSVVEYAVALARASRPSDPQAPAMIRKYVEWGAGPRAGQNLVHAAKARAAMQGRPTPAVEDVRWAAQPVLRHRVIPNYAAVGDGVDAKRIVAELLDAKLG